MSISGGFGVPIVPDWDTDGSYVVAKSRHFRKEEISGAHKGTGRARDIRRDYYALGNKLGYGLRTVMGYRRHDSERSTVLGAVGKVLVYD